MGGRIEVVVKLHCGTVLGDEFAAMLKMRSPKQSHNELWQPFQPGLPRSLKVANWQLRGCAGIWDKIRPPNSTIMQFDTKVKVEGLLTVASALGLSRYSHSTQIIRNKQSKQDIRGLKTPTGRQEKSKSMVEDLRAVLEFRTARLWVRRAEHSASLPPSSVCLMLVLLYLHCRCSILLFRCWCNVGWLCR